MFSRRYLYLILTSVLFINYTAADKSDTYIQQNSHIQMEVGEISLLRDQTNQIAVVSCNKLFAICTSINKTETISILDTLSMGDREGNGGNPLISYFKVKAIETIENLMSMYHANKDKFLSIGMSHQILYRLTEVANSVSISCTPDELILNGAQVLAINYPNLKPQQIKLNCKQFSDTSPYMQTSFILHEVLFLAGINDTNYSISTSLIQLKQTYSRKDLLSTLQTNLAALKCDIDSYREHVDFADLSGSIYNEPPTLSRALDKGCQSILKDLIQRNSIYGLSFNNKYHLAVSFLRYIFDYKYGQDLIRKKELRDITFLIKDIIQKNIGFQKDYFNTCEINYKNAGHSLIDSLKKVDCKQLSLSFLVMKLNSDYKDESIMRLIRLIESNSVELK